METPPAFQNQSYCMTQEMVKIKVENFQFRQETEKNQKLTEYLKQLLILKVEENHKLQADADDANARVGILDRELKRYKKIVLEHKPIARVRKNKVLPKSKNGKLRKLQAESAMNLLKDEETKKKTVLQPSNLVHLQRDKQIVSFKEDVDTSNNFHDEDDHSLYSAHSDLSSKLMIGNKGNPSFDLGQQPEHALEGSNQLLNESMSNISFFLQTLPSLSDPQDDVAPTTSLAPHSGNQERSTRAHTSSEAAASVYHVEDVQRRKALLEKDCDGGYKYFCTCGMKAVSKRELNGHIEQHDNRRKFQCDMCPKRFLYFSHLGAHYRDTHFSPNYLDDVIKDCRKCGGMFKTKREYRQHAFRNCNN